MTWLQLVVAATLPVLLKLAIDLIWRWRTSRPPRPPRRRTRRAQKHDDENPES